MSATIDLGELRRGAPVEIAPHVARRSIRERLRRIRGWRLRAAAVTVVLALVGTTMAGAATLPEPWLSFLFSVPGTDFAIDADRLYVVDPSTPEGSIAAYRLDGGTTLWRHSSTEPGLSLQIWRGLLLARTVTSDGAEHTSRLDRDTGRPLWIRDGWPAGEAGDRLLLERQLRQDGEVAGPPYEVAAVDPVSGEPAWVLVLTSWSAQTTASGPARLVDLTDRGGLVSYDLATGRPVRTVATTTSPGRAYPLVAGSTVLLHEPVETGFAVTAYDLGALTRRWAMRDRVARIAPCGSLLCLHGPVTPRAIDPAAGRTMWTAEWARRGQDGWFSTHDAAAVMLADQLVLTLRSDDGEQRTWLVDADTGGQVLNLQEWSLPSYPEARDQPALLIRSGNGALWVGRLRPDLSRVDTLGALDEPGRPDLLDPGCGFTAEHVVCGGPLGTADGPDELRVWRLR